MGLVETVVLVLALAGLSVFLVVDCAKFEPAPGALAKFCLENTEFEKKRKASAGLCLAGILALGASSFLVVLLMRLLGLTGLKLVFLALAMSLGFSLVLPSLALRHFHGRRHGCKSLLRFLRFLLLPAEVSARFLFGVPRCSAGPHAPQEGGGRPDARDRAALTFGFPGLGSPYARDLLRFLLRLRERHISEVMIPRVELVCADERSTITELAELVSESSHTRIPIFSGNIDSIRGYVTAKDVVLLLHQGKGHDAVHAILRKPVFVSLGTSIERTLEQMQTEHSTLAIVVEPSGQTAGLVTGEDILEEVVGDLYEDYEPEEPAYRLIDEKTAHARANVKVGDLKEILGAIPSRNPEQTLGEYVRVALGAEPVVGERVSDSVFIYTVLRTTGKTIWSLEIEKRS